MMRVAFVLAVAVLSVGCTRDRCRSEIEYQQAQSLPPADVQGLNNGVTAGALIIPPAPSKVVPYDRIVQDGSGRTRYECLDVPPRKS